MPDPNWYQYGSPWASRPGDGVQVTKAATHGQFAPGPARTLLGAVIYAARLPDGVIKIGCTSNLGVRMWQLGAGTTLLGFRPGLRPEELQLHRTLRAHVHHGREYYHPTPEVMAVVNEMRDTLGLEPVCQPVG